MEMISVWRLAGDDQIRELLQDTSRHVEDLLDEEGEDFDLGRAWHAIHFLLAGTAGRTAGPRGYILGGHELEGASLGYGPARVLTPEELAVFDDLLQCTPVEELRKRFDPDALRAARVYPDIWEREQTGEEDVLPYLEAQFVLLKRFVAAGRSERMGAITYLA